MRGINVSGESRARAHAADPVSWEKVIAGMVSANDKGLERNVAETGTIHRAARAVILGVAGLGVLLALSLGTALFLGIRRAVAEVVRLNADLEVRVLERTRQLSDANARLRHEHEARERVELQLRLAQKLQAVGQLAAGVAHEINTPMQFIGDNVNFLRDAVGSLIGLTERYRDGIERLEAAGGHQPFIEALRQAEADADLDYLLEQTAPSCARAIDGVERVSSIVQVMKAFSHPDQKEMRPANLRTALESTLVVARNEYKYVAEVETDLAPIPDVLCHAGELNQVFLNVIVNAAHAIGDVVKESGQKGLISIATRPEHDGRVLITVRDTGTGIPEAIRDRVFDPFFTTKEVGKGTGQGMTIARAVVDKHGGSLSLESEVGRGTTIFIRLPTTGPVALAA